MARASQSAAELVAPGNRPSPAEETSPQRGPLLCKGGSTIADQALSSATNFLLSAFVARSVGTVEFGAFALVFSLYQVSLGLARCLVGEAFVVRQSTGGDARWRAAAAEGAGAALALGVAGAVVAAAVAALVPSRSSRILLSLAAMLPGLLLQDFWRYSFFAAGRPIAAACNDLVWATVQITAAVALARRGVASAWPFVLTWGLAANVAAVFGISQSGVRPAPSRARAWFAAHQDVVGGYLGDFALTVGIGQTAIFWASTLDGLDGAAAWRGAALLMGPVNVALVASSAFVLPEMQRRSSERRLHRAAAATGAALSVGTLLWTLFLALVPDAIGAKVLGESWQPARRLLIPFAAWLMVAGWMIGITIGMRAALAGGAIARLRAELLPVTIAAIVVGGLLDGTRGVAAGLAVGAALQLPIWWRALRRVEAS